MDFVFDLVDLWSNTAIPLEYSRYLRALLECATQDKKQASVESVAQADACMRMAVAKSHRTPVKKLKHRHSLYKNYRPQTAPSERWPSPSVTCSKPSTFKFNSRRKSFKGTSQNPDPGAYDPNLSFITPPEPPCGGAILKTARMRAKFRGKVFLGPNSPVFNSKLLGGRGNLPLRAKKNNKGEGTMSSNSNNSPFSPVRVSKPTWHLKASPSLKKRLDVDASAAIDLKVRNILSDFSLVKSSSAPSLRVRDVLDD